MDKGEKLCSFGNVDVLEHERRSFFLLFFFHCVPCWRKPAGAAGK